MSSDKKDVVNFVEEKLHINLLPYQKEILRLNQQYKGYEYIFFPRYSGRALYYKTMQELSNILFKGENE